MQKYMERFLSTVSQSLSKATTLANTKVSAARPILHSFQERVLSTSSVKLQNLQKQLDDLFSVTEVRDAQLIVNNVEKEFLEARSLANQIKKELAEVRISLEDARKTLDRCPRDSENFLKHVAEEHAIINKEKRMRSEYEMKEQKERELFTEYSNAVRVSHEKERERAQKTKYLSIIASVGGAVVGFLGSSLITYYRLKQIRQMTSPELIIKEISNEIRENKLTEEELDKLFETNSVKLMENLDEKLMSYSKENRHSGNVDKNLAKYVDILEENGKVIKNFKDDLKKQLDVNILKVSEASKDIIAGLQKSTGQLSAASRANKEHYVTDMNKKLTKVEDNIVTSINAASDKVISETNTTLRREFSKIQHDQKHMNDQMLNAKMQNVAKESLLLDSEIHSEASWYPEANLILSFFSFSLLVYLIMTRN